MCMCLPYLYQKVFNVSKWKLSADYESVGGQTLSGGTSSKNSPNPNGRRDIDAYIVFAVIWV